MKKILFFLFPIIISFQSFSQKPEDFGYRHFTIKFKNDNVDILIKSRNGEENIKKPLFLFCQGSLPHPLIILDKDGKPYSIAPFKTDSLEKYYHIAFISKPYIPLIAQESVLDNYNFIDSTAHTFPLEYIKRNVIDYYVERNIAVINFLKQQKWIDAKKIIIAGHSEGSNLVAQIAYKCKDVKYVIYASGNALGRIMAIIANDRQENLHVNFKQWQSIVDSPYVINNKGDAYKATYGFSYPPPIYFLEKLKIPVLVCYGTKDPSALLNDYLQVEMIRQKKKNFSFYVYDGLEHNFFGLKPDGSFDENQFHWDEVVNDWLTWLKKN